MNEMTLPSRHKIQNSSPGGLSRARYVSGTEVPTILNPDHIARHVILASSRIGVIKSLYQEVYAVLFTCQLNLEIRSLWSIISPESCIGLLNEWGFRPYLCTYRLNRWDEWDDTTVQTQDSKIKYKQFSSSEAGNCVNNSSFDWIKK